MWQSYKAELTWVAARARRRFRCALSFALAFKALNFIVLAPLAAAILRLCLTLWGRASVGNFELVSFFLSPAGLAALMLVGSILIASLYLELSGLIRLLADDRLHWWEAFKSSTRFFPRLLQLGLRQLGLLLALAIPFLIGIGLAYWWFWSGKDLNGLIILRPPAFWQGAAVAGLFAIAFALVAAWVLLRQIHAVPILTLEPATSARDALRTSAERSRGTLLFSAGALAAWFVVQSVLAAVILGCVHLVALWVLGRSGPSLALVVLATGIMLAINAIVATGLSVLANVTLAGVVLALYRHTAPAGAIAVAAAREPQAPSRTLGWRVALALAAGITLAAVFSVLSISELALSDGVEITAHRAGAALAPENTVAALKLAIADGSDWAEIDVQLTADQQLVVMHDIDLARVGGGSRRVDQATLAEIQALDVGTPFAAKFAGERIPTLQEILAAAEDHIRLNVELKPHSKADAPKLTRRVLVALREAKMLPRCRLCSQSYESLALAREMEPELEVGYIVATSVGDPTELAVNFLMIKSNLATRALVDRARLRGIAIHAWTVNDPALVAPLLDAGVANLITDDPARIRAKLDEIRTLSVPERLLLRARHAVSR